VVAVRGTPAWDCDICRAQTDVDDNVCVCETERERERERLAEGK